MPAQQPASVAIEQLLHQAAAPLSLEQITQATGTSKEQARNALRTMRDRGRLKRHGSTQKATYSINAKYRCDIGVLSPQKQQPTTAKPHKTAKVVHPKGLQVQHIPTPRHAPYVPQPWPAETARPEGFDHLNIPSLRGTVRVPHRAPMGM